LYTGNREKSGETQRRAQVRLSGEKVGEGGGGGGNPSLLLFPPARKAKREKKVFSS